MSFWDGVVLKRRADFLKLVGGWAKLCHVQIRAYSYWLMLKFSPAKSDASKLTNSNLDPIAGLVQSLRWYNSRASSLLYFWGMHETMASVASRPDSVRSLPAHAFHMLRRAILHSVILELRALHDRDARSLGSCQIGNMLLEPVARGGLEQYLANNFPNRAMEDLERRGRYFSYVQRYAAIMAPKRGVALPLHPLTEKVDLIRRMANKSIAHSTLDNYILGGEDLGDVVLASIIIACAIESAIGDAAVSSDFAAVESSGYIAAGSVLGVEVDSSPYNVNMIRGFLPAWVASGEEFPEFPADFLRGTRLSARKDFCE